jgi:hypothetical protein
MTRLRQRRRGEGGVESGDTTAPGRGKGDAMGGLEVTVKWKEEMQGWGAWLGSPGTVGLSTKKDGEDEHKLDSN